MTTLQFLWLTKLCTGMPLSSRENWPKLVTTHVNRCIGVGFGPQLQPCQNVSAAGKFAIFSQFLPSYSTLDFTRSPLAGKGTWHLLPTTPSVLPTATKHFDRAEAVHIS